MRAAAGTCGSHVSKRAHRRAGGDFPLPKEQAVYIDTIVYGLACTSVDILFVNFYRCSERAELTGI